MYTGPHYPNSTTNEVSYTFVSECGDGCLYELKSDPLERRDLAREMPEQVKKLRAKLEAYEATAFNPNRGYISHAACAAAMHKYGGFWGPFMA